MFKDNSNNENYFDGKQILRNFLFVVLVIKGRLANSDQYNMGKVANLENSQGS